MIYGVYSIYDAAATVYQAPFTALNDDVATRQFAFAFSDPKSIYSLNPADFELVYIGDYDAQTGELKPSPRRIVSRGNDYVA